MNTFIQQGCKKKNNPVDPKLIDLNMTLTPISIHSVSHFLNIHVVPFDAVLHVLSESKAFGLPTQHQPGFKTYQPL